jgi:hypothetical protein
MDITIPVITACQVVTYKRNGMSIFFESIVRLKIRIPQLLCTVVWGYYLCSGKISIINKYKKYYYLTEHTLCTCFMSVNP